MSKPRIKIGKDSKGRTAIKIRIAKDDPIRPYIIALAQKAAYKIQDADGFYEEKEPEIGTPDELEALIMNLLPPDLRKTFEEEAAVVKTEAIDEFMNSDLSGIFGLLTGNMWEQQSALKENPNLKPLENLGGIMKETVDSVLGDTSIANHVRSEIQKGSLDVLLKPTQDSQPQDPHQP